MKAEHGIRLGSRPLERDGGLAAQVARFDWVYLGAEFCENLLDPRFCDEAAALQRLGKKVCLLTPLLSEKGVKSLSAIFDGLLKLAKAGRLDPACLEVTVNDFGAIELASKKKLPFRLSSGRQLSGNMLMQTPRQWHMLSRRGLEFFSRLGVSRLELSTAGGLPDTNFDAPGFDFSGLDFSITLFYPYLNLTTTRTCLVGLKDIPSEESVKGIVCGRECQACAFRIGHPWVLEKLYTRGNTVFMEFPQKIFSAASQLKDRRVDRLVYCPFP